MSLQFLTRAPFTDVSKLKDEAKRSAKVNQTKLSYELERKAQAIAGCSWGDLLRDHVATLEDGVASLSVDGLPVRIAPYHVDREGGPLAVGEHTSISYELELPEFIPGGAQELLPYLLVTYGLPDSTNARDRAHLDTKTPTLIDGTSLPEADLNSPRIPLRQRVGPVARAIREWVKESHSQPVFNPDDMSKEDLDKLARDEVIRMSSFEAMDLNLDIEERTQAFATPEQRVLFGLWLVRLFPMYGEGYAMMLAHSSTPLPEQIEILRRGVAVEKHRLHWQLDLQDVAWWSDAETRTYMRGARRLADLYTQAGKPDEALRIYQELLELNPNDNQGNRYPCLGLLLTHSTPQSRREARDLVNAYADLEEPMVLHGAALLSYQEHGDDARSRGLRSRAFMSNPRISEFLPTPAPTDLPESYSFGTVDEAIICMSFFRAAFHATPGAVAWMTAA